MPIYGYRCTQCGHELEVFQSMSDARLETCPVCGGDLRKLLYPVGVQFKGSGFYSTDYKNGRGAASSEAKGGESSSDKAETPASGGESSSSAKSKKKADAPADKR